MSGWPFRFVHASDFHLELPLFGVAHVPPHLRDKFIEAPYRAAERVFDTVLAEGARFLILSGDVINAPLAGARGVLFLLQQFERLAERDVAVYWAAGRVDPASRWPAAMPLPPNVHTFPTGQVGHFVHAVDEEISALLVGSGRGRSGRFDAAALAEVESAHGREHYSIAVVHGAEETAALQNSAFNYWALGGEHDRQTLFNSPAIAHYPGSPQGREPAEVGTHGCTVIEVDSRGVARTNSIATDVLRWQAERVVVGEDWTEETLLKRLINRAEHLRDGSGGVDQLVAWTLAGDSPLLHDLGDTRATRPLVERLRQQFGYDSDDAKEPLLWSLSLDFDTSQSLPLGWYDEETLRGEFVRQVQELEQAPREPLGLEAFLPADYVDTSLGAEMATPSGSSRGQVLQRASRLGAELLSGDGDSTPLPTTP
ncbi:MAG: hypothetical protein DWQ35_07605 [Planctomycetota bacterium]|nr:MAG: hypothetical protein DWQ35_07605 [Planctomycetota bacterium]REK31558.1 MAG: hypothetical protein DWQ42_00260 [Planctomycetota bacterium]REK43104.1 MAG: hypothetical protein DWQ46_12070 [Planctomycetota bacterium]